jgi:predicted dehydrogenase
MYRDFVRSVREGRQPEMDLETAIDDQRLMDQIYSNLRIPDPPRRRSGQAGSRIPADL